MDFNLGMGQGSDPDLEQHFLSIASYPWMPFLEST